MLIFTIFFATIDALMEEQSFGGPYSVIPYFCLHLGILLMSQTIQGGCCLRRPVRPQGMFHLMTASLC